MTNATRLALAILVLGRHDIYVTPSNEAPTDVELVIASL